MRTPLAVWMYTCSRPALLSGESSNVSRHCSNEAAVGKGREHQLSVFVARTGEADGRIGTKDGDASSCDLHQLLLLSNPAPALGPQPLTARCERTCEICVVCLPGE